MGKSALLDYLTDRATGWLIARAAGVESEMEVAYSGLHQLCGPLLAYVDRLPPPQRDALATVFGQSAGPAPDRLLVGIATLSLLAEVAEHQPLACIIDDAQWLDHASAGTIAFAARRIAADRIAIVCAARTGSGDDALTGLPTWSIDGLADSDARALLLGNMRGPLDAAICARIIVESRGNPLALLELPRTWDSANLAGGLGFPGNEPVANRVEHSYGRRIEQLPAKTRLLTLTAAAEPLGDLVLLHRALEIIGVDIAAAGPAIDDGLLTIDARVSFAHPLVRSAAYHSASERDRREVHRALGDATDPETDPDRRAWHRASATLGPNEEIAAELEGAAGRAQSRGGVAATAAFLQRAVALTMEPVRRAERALMAAEASLQAGAFDASLELLVTAESRPLDAFHRARVDLVRAQVAFASGAMREAPPLLLKAAQQLEPFDPELARETYLHAWASSIYGDHHTKEIRLAISRAILALPSRPGSPKALDVMLEGVALLITDGLSAAASTLQRAAKALATVPLDDVLRWGSHTSAPSDALWDNDGARAILERNAQLIRNAGALTHLVPPLQSLGNTAMRSGDFTGAALHYAEAESISAATGARYPPYQSLRLLALQGKEQETTTLIARSLEQADEGVAIAASVARWAAAILNNGFCRYEEAVKWAQLAASEEAAPFIPAWALPELVEAAVRSGDVELARDALARLVRTTQPAGTDYALGIEARCRALLEIGDADDLYQEAIERLSRARLRPDLARAHLLYGEWLRRDGRRVDAREQLRLAHDLCTAIGMEAFGERARRELAATGERVRKRSDEPRAELTAQEEQIARLARDGLTNPEIGAVMFLSPRTVEWHLRKVFTKLDISSRNGLHTALPSGAGESRLV